MRYFLTCVLFLGLALNVAAAQEADSAAVVVDSLEAGPAAVRDTLAADTLRFAADTLMRANGVSPIGFDVQERGRALTDSLPALLPILDLVDILAGVPGSFTYLFDTPGWPDGWSLYGLPPQATALAFNGNPFTHVFTGRPAFELVPLSATGRPRLEINRFGRPFAVESTIRPFVSPVPLTEGTYWKGSNGLQSIEAIHAQNRRRSLFGKPGFLNLVASYGGRASNGEYPGSDLRRGRQVLLRLRYEQRDWAFEMLNLHNRRRIGAHGGVVPDPGDFGSIYRRNAAVVENPEAYRRIIRNDLTASFRGRLWNAYPTSIGAYWTAESFRYVTPNSRVETVADRLGVRFGQPVLQTARHQLAVHLESWTEHVSPRGGFLLDGMRFSRIHAYVRDTLHTRALRVETEAGIGVSDGSLQPEGSLSMELQAGSLSFDAAASVSGRMPAAVDVIGFGSLAGLAGVPSGRTLHTHGSVRYRAGAFEVALGVFAGHLSHPVDYFAIGSDSAAVRAASQAFRRVGAFGEIGWRRNAARGFYWILQPTLTQLLDSDASPLHARVAETLPSISGRMRLGARYVLFRGDLDLDVYLEGTAWSSFRSRTFLEESGLLAVPEAGARTFGPSGILDAVVEAQVRDATIFLVYENALSGTTLLRGNLVVPIYPLPAQRFRFGVYWPIFG